MGPAEARALVARIRFLRRASPREREGHFIIEGPGAVATAVERAWPIAELVYSSVLCTSGHARRRVRDASETGVAVHRVDPETYRRLSSTPRASGVLAILREVWTQLARLPPAPTPVHLAVRQARSPGNLGTLLRSLEAVAGGGLLCLGDALDPFSSSLVRASMGALLRRPVVRVGEGALSRWARHHGVRVVGASPRAGQAYDQVDFSLPTVLLLGEERQGLDERDGAICDDMVHLPIVGEVDSLNLGVAGSVLLYEALRQRRARASPATEA